MDKLKLKKLNLKKDKIILSAFAVVLSLYTAFSCTYFAYAAKSVRNDVVRLHILANSDSKEDQDVKLKVRDALLKKNTVLLTEGVNKDNARQYFEASKAELLKTAKETLKQYNFDYDVKIKLVNEYFETRQYGSLTFPSGKYTALRVVLGEGKGHNWWCVMFPPLCVPAASGEINSQENKTTQYLTESGNDLVKGGKKYKIKFKLLEIYEEFAEKIKG